MLRSKHSIMASLAALIFFIASFSALSMQTTIQIITPVPTPKEVILVPKGYVSCFTVGEGWYQEVWYPKRRICQYDQYATTSTLNNTMQGNAWIESYWTCTKYLTAGPTSGQCTNWEWHPGHRVNSLAIY